MSAAFAKARLADVADLNPPLGDILVEGETVSFLPMSAVDADSVEAVDSATRPFTEVSKGYTPFLPNDVLVAKITPCFENGKIALAKPRQRFGFGSTEFHVVRAHSRRLDPRYLVHFMRQERIRLDGQRKMTGSAGQRRVPEHFLAGLEIPLPPLSEQRRIAEILDKADALRAKRRAALAQLDTLTQSIFFDMFGDPLVNPKKFPIRSLAEFYSSRPDGTKCGPFGSALKKDELMSEGIPVWNMDNIGTSGRMVLPFRMWISESKYRQLETYSVATGDVIVSRAGTVGKMCVVRLGSAARSIISTNLIRVRFGPDILPLYFVSLMMYCKGRVGRLKTGADGALTHMNTGILDTLTLPYPPLDLQRRFVAIVDSIDEQRKKFEAQLDACHALFTSLQHCAFRGER